MSATTWHDNSIQFPRLLAEIAATVELTEDQWDDLLASMDLETDDLRELFDRAQEAWEGIVADMPFSILVTSFGHKEYQSFDNFAEFTIQDEDEAYDIAKRMLDGTAPYIFNEPATGAAPEFYQEFTIHDRELLIQQLAEAEESLASWQEGHGAEQTGLGKDER